MKKKLLKRGVILVGIMALVLVLGPATREWRMKGTFQKHRDTYRAVASEVIAKGSTDVDYWPPQVADLAYWEPRDQTVEFLMGYSGFGSSTTYWGFTHVPDDTPRGFQGWVSDYWEPEGEGRLYYDPEGDNTCYVVRLEPGWFYYEMRL